MFSASNAAISSCNTLLSSVVLMYFSAATLFSTRAIILRVVSTPTSAPIRISSKLSKTSSSTLDFPATAFDSLEKKDVFVFSNPLSNCCFSCSVITGSLLLDENIFLKVQIYIYPYLKWHMYLLNYFQNISIISLQKNQFQIV